LIGVVKKSGKFLIAAPIKSFAGINPEGATRVSFQVLLVTACWSKPIGTPGDVELGQSVSKGILSGKRKVSEIIYLQTYVAVSPGNSGGPLIDERGQIVGIIQRKLVGAGIEGVGFALPIETAMKQLGLEVVER
jgi:hypothetical protein